MPTNSMSEKIVDRLVKSGRYASRDEAVQEATRLLEERETILNDAWTGIEEGLADMEAGRVYPAEEVRERLMKRFSAKN